MPGMARRLSLGISGLGRTPCLETQTGLQWLKAPSRCPMMLWKIRPWDCSSGQRNLTRKYQTARHGRKPTRPLVTRLRNGHSGRLPRMTQKRCSRQSAYANGSPRPLPRRSPLGHGRMASMQTQSSRPIRRYGSALTFQTIGLGHRLRSAVCVLIENGTPSLWRMSRALVGCRNGSPTAHSNTTG